MGQWTRTHRDSKHAPPAWAFPVLYILGLLFVSTMLYCAWRYYGTSYVTLSAIAAVGYVLLAPIAWRLGDKVRQYAMPDGYYSRDFAAAVRARVFWSIGPQTISMYLLCVGSLVVSVLLPELRDKEQREADGRSKSDTKQERSVDTTTAAQGDPMGGGMVSRHFSDAQSGVSLTLVRGANGKYSVYSMTSDGCTGDVEDLDGAEFGPEGGVLQNDLCELDVTLKGKNLEVAASASCDDWTGMACRLSGQYVED